MQRDNKPKTQLILYRPLHGQNPYIEVGGKRITIDDAESQGLIEYKLDESTNCWVVTFIENFNQNQKEI